MLKKSLEVLERNGFIRVEDPEGDNHRRAWSGDLFAPFYDRIMANSLFPRKFAASYSRHMAVIGRLFAGVSDQSVLDIAAGTAVVVEVLPDDNDYYGVDVSERLLKRAAARLTRSGIRSWTLYSSPAEYLPFETESFDLVSCQLALNFFESQDRAVAEAARVLRGGARFIGSVPVPERNRSGATIRGNLLGEQEIRRLFERHGFSFVPRGEENGAVFYFTATKIKRPGV